MTSLSFSLVEQQKLQLSPETVLALSEAPSMHIWAEPSLVAHAVVAVPFVALLALEEVQLLHANPLEGAALEEVQLVHANQLEGQRAAYAQIPSVQAEDIQELSAQMPSVQHATRWQHLPKQTDYQMPSVQAEDVQELSASAWEECQDEPQRSLVSYLRRRPKAGQQ